MLNLTWNKQKTLTNVVLCPPPKKVWKTLTPHPCLAMLPEVGENFCPPFSWRGDSIILLMNT